MSLKKLLLVQKQLLKKHAEIKSFLTILGMITKTLGTVNPFQRTRVTLSSRPPGQHDKTPSLLKIQKLAGRGCGCL